MITGVQPKLVVSFDEDGNMQLDPLQAELLGLVENEFNWKLIRERDKIVKESAKVLWFEWNEEGRFKSKHKEPAIGRSLIMSPFNEFFTWQTTEVIEIVEQRDNYIKFKTQNSNYELFYIGDNSREQ